MPWCDTCDVYLAPNTVEGDGTCPTCHDPVDAADAKVEPQAKPPWHFWLVVVALVGYLGWRVVEAASWIVERL